MAEARRFTNGRTTNAGARLRSPLVFLLVLLLASTAVAAALPGGKVLSLDGEVQVSSDGGATWRPAVAGSPLAVGDLIKTGSRSRAAILLSDETQLRLNAYAVLTITEVAADAAKTSKLELAQGQAWVRTKNRQRTLELNTPTATAAVRGTELVLSASPAQSDLIVTEGEVVLRNDQGDLSVREGQGGVARKGQAPEAKVVVSPENAVQWVLYYPELDQPYEPLAPERLRAVEARIAEAPADGAARLQLIQHHLARAEWDQALRLTAAASAATTAAYQPGVLRARLAALAHTGHDPLDAIDAERAVVDASPLLLTDAAGYHLAIGDADGATTELGKALALDPRQQDALAMRGLISLIKNDLAAADSAIDASLAVEPQHFLTQMVASRLSQAHFAMDAALAHVRAARTLNPRSVEAVASEAELLYGSGQTESAAKLLSAGLADHADSPRLNSIDGFLRLGRSDVKGAEAAFGKAIARDPNRAEAHLGRGLALFQTGARADGLEEMLAATTLAPNISLYQSYLAKSYYEMRRFPEAEAVLATAKRLDPRDPTPHVYAAVMARDQYRETEAIDELEMAMTKNGNRGVYRSRLLLDEDRATRTVSLGQMYNEVGFEALGWHHAMRGVEWDHFNAGAQRFLSDVINGQVNRAAYFLRDNDGLGPSSVSLSVANNAEKLGTFLAPVNRSSLASQNEYTSLLESPGIDGRVRYAQGQGDRRDYRANASGGGSRIAYLVSSEGEHRGSPYGPHTDQYFEYPHVEVAAALTPSQTLGGQLAYSAYGGDATDDGAYSDRYPNGSIDYVYRSSANSTLMIEAFAAELQDSSTDPNDYADSVPGLPKSDFERTIPERRLSAAHQLTHGRHQLFTWVGWQRVKDRAEGVATDGERSEEQYGWDETGEVASAMLQYKLRLDRLAFTFGLKRDTADFKASASWSDVPGSDSRRNWLPRAGLWWDVTDGSTLRLAAFQAADVTDQSTLLPNTLAGFLVHRDSDGILEWHEDVAVGWDQKVGKRLYFTTELTKTRFDHPRYDYPAVTGRITHHRLRLYSEAALRLSRSLVVQGSTFLTKTRLGTTPSTGWAGYPGLAVLYNDEHGYKASVRYLYRHEPFTDPDGGDESVVGRAHIVDLGLSKALPNRLGSLGIEVRNLFNEDYDPAVVPFRGDDYRWYVRRVSAFAEWNF